MIKTFDEAYRWQKAVIDGYSGTYDAVSQIRQFATSVITDPELTWDDPERQAANRLLSWADTAAGATLRSLLSESTP